MALKKINWYLKWVFTLCVLISSSAYASDNLFRCKTDKIEGTTVSALFSIKNTGAITLDFFDKNNIKAMACRLSTIYAKFSPRAQTNNIAFDFNKDSCVLLSRNLKKEPAVRDNGFLKISDSVVEGEHNSYLLIINDIQPLACDIKKIERAELEYLAEMISQNVN